MEILDTSSQNFASFPIDETTEEIIDFDDHIFGVGEYHPLLHACDHGRQLCVFPPRRFLGAFDFTDVDEAFQQAAAISQKKWDDGLENRHFTATCGQQDPFGVVHGLPKVVDGALALFSRTDKLMADLADDLFPGQPDHGRGRRIDIHDGPCVRIDDHDPGLYGVEYVFEPLFGLAQAIIGLSPLGDIEPAAQQADDMAFGIPQQGAVPCDETLLAATRPDSAFQIVFRGNLSGYGLLKGCPDHFPLVGGQKRLEPVIAENGIGGAFEQFTPLAVDQRHVPFQVQSHKHDTGNLKVHLGKFFFLAQGLFHCLAAFYFHPAQFQ